MDKLELRRSLSNELHARLFHDFEGAGRLIRYVYLTENSHQDAADYINGFLRSNGQPDLVEGQKFLRIQLDDFVFRVERHSEYLSVSFIESQKKQATGLLPGAFDPATTSAPLNWARNLPAPLFNAIWIELGGKAPRHLDQASVMAMLDSRSVTGNLFSDEAAQIHFSFDIDSNGFSRVAVFNNAIPSHRMGRVVQRIVEAETYRMMALLGFATVQDHSADLGRIETVISSLTNDLAEQIKQTDGQLQNLLSILSAQAADVEEIHSKTSYRLAATKAYYSIMDERLNTLKLTRLSGFQGARGFLVRRMNPAMDSCRAFEARLDQLSERIARAGNLLQTQTEMIIQRQNRDLLASMNDRARDQLRLQLTVERLSIAAVTYYGVGLVGYLAKALPLAQWGLNLNYIKAAAVPVIALAVYGAIRSVHNRKR
ncbi:MAG: DUF3422 domain-containing protein [Alphaproteobacteria bacterium]|nr:DUF3422 domain-containing protein [Alphaproteobacteria bacterium]